MTMPAGKFAATVRVGEKGQIVIPKAARDLFDIKPGDTLLLLADLERGIAIVRTEGFQKFMDDVLGPPGTPEAPPSRDV